LDLVSVPPGDIVKTMTSSGTTGQAVSKIYLDRATSANQQKVLVKIVSDFIRVHVATDSVATASMPIRCGDLPVATDSVTTASMPTTSARLPMLIIDSPSVIKNRAMFSARGAGILGFSIFGADKAYALDDNMEINTTVVESFLEKHSGEKVLLFGFTFMIWQHFYKALLKSSQRFDLSNAFLIHGGGWKKLSSEAVSHDVFRARLTEVCGLSDVHDYYGMVEQTGCIYMECECGHLHASVFSDVIMRRHTDFSICDIGEPGIIQVVSVLPESYPGHSLLTEDEGVLLGEDDCPCGRAGKYFRVIGRLANAEIRGCSDTYTQRR
jgi:hypothetical protein